MSTEVKHGKSPQFTATANMDEEFFCSVVGHYTTTPDLAAAGVEDYAFQSARPIKRQPELLALRSAFSNWFVLMWVECGGTIEEALHHLSYNSSGFATSAPSTPSR